MFIVKSLAVLVACFIVLFTSHCAWAKTASPTTVAVGGRPVIAADSNGHLHLIFEGGREGGTHLYHLKTSNQGSIWSNPVDISPEHSIAQYGSLAIDKSGVIYVAWNGTKKIDPKDRAEICFTKLSESGQILSKAHGIFESACARTGPCIAVGGDGTVHLVWCEVNAGNSQGSIFYSRSSDQGASWQKKQLLAVENHKEGCGVSSQPTVVVSEDGAVHASWVDFNPGKKAPDIFYAKCENGKWSTPIDVSRSERTAQQPIIATGRDKKVFLTWLDNSRKELAPDIWCAVDSHESAFSKPLNISDTPGVSGEPAIAADRRGRVAIVWSDTTSGVNKPDIYGRVSLDSLADFTNLIDFSNTEGRSKLPSVAIAGERLFVVWEEVAEGSRKILMNTMSLEGVATGPTPKVDQEIHGASSNSR